MDADAAAELESIQECAQISLIEGSLLSQLEAVTLLLNQLRGNNATNVLAD